MNNPHHSNEWDKEPECNPGGEPLSNADLNSSIGLRVTQLIQSTIVDVARLVPDDPRKTQAIMHLESAKRLCAAVCEEKPGNQ